jgi:hypothetical protein
LGVQENGKQQPAANPAAMSLCVLRRHVRVRAA